MPVDIYKCCFAWAMWRVARHYDRLLADRKHSLLARASGAVLEIGPGTGTNFQYFPRGIRWIGVEPNRFMHPYLRLAAERAGIEIDIRHRHAEELDLADRSVDTVIATAVLCSVEDPIKALNEIRRVLKPGGQFVFIEHVAGERGTILRAIQILMQPFWTCIADGCHPARDIARAITRAGLRPLIFDSFRLPLGPLGPHIAGIAVPES